MYLIFPYFFEIWPATWQYYRWPDCKISKWQKTSNFSALGRIRCKSFYSLMHHTSNSVLQPRRIRITLHLECSVLVVFALVWYLSIWPTVGTPNNMRQQFDMKPLRAVIVNSNYINKTQPYTLWVINYKLKRMATSLEWRHMIFMVSQFTHRSTASSSSLFMLTTWKH